MPASEIVPSILRSRTLCSSEVAAVEVAVMEETTEAAAEEAAVKAAPVLPVLIITKVAAAVMVLQTTF